MPASEARVLANRKNAAHSTGPRTTEGKERSRANALKHGLTGAGVVLPDGDAAEVEELARAFQEELDPPGEVGRALARRMAVLSVRMDRCVDREFAAVAERVRRARDEFEAPEGVGPEEAERLRDEAGRLASFDPSDEASLARRYEAAAERGFFRALKELRQLGREPASSGAAGAMAEVRASAARLGSFLQGETPAPRGPSPSPPKPLPAPSKVPAAAWDPSPPTHFDVPFAIGRSR